MVAWNNNKANIAIINCGVGNIGSLQNALKVNQHKIDVIQSPELLPQYDRVVLPGVGSFGGFVRRLTDLGFTNALKNYVKLDDKKLIGICVGMQVLFDTGFEHGKHQGLGLIPGEVKKIVPDSNQYQIPHVGWNDVKYTKDIFTNFSGDYYFTHSYEAITSESHIDGVVHYGHDIVASVSNGQVYGFQFHPEKSGKLGSKLINFVCS